MDIPDSTTLNAIIIAAAIVAVAVLSASEASFIAVSKIRIRSLLESGDSRARAAQGILDQHDRLFTVVILSGNLFTVLATSLGTALAIDLFGEDYGIVIATAAMTYLTVVFGELAPKTFAVAYSERLALFLAKPLYLYIRVLSPLLWIFNFSASLILRLFGVHGKPKAPYVTEEEIRAMINIGQEEGTIEEDEKKLLHRVFEFGDTEVSEAMVPRTEMVVISASASVAEALKLVSEKGYSRYPVVGESVDEVLGMLYIKDILITMSQTDVGGLAVRNFMRDAYFVPETKMATAMLDDMRKFNLHVAVVTDEYGGTAGFVTLEDLMEEIIGALEDEFESLEAGKDVQIIDERTYVVSGQASIDEVNESMETNIKSDDFNTIGGFVFGLFGRLPKVGEQVRSHDLRFLILEMDGRKVARVKITKL